MSLDELNFKTKHSSKGKAKVFTVLTLILSVAFLTTLLMYDVYEKTWEETEVEFKTNTLAEEPIIKDMVNATPTAGVVSSFMFPDVLGGVQFDADETFDGAYLTSPDLSTDENPYVHWMGSNQETEWTLQWYLGGARDVSNIRFQIPDVHYYSGTLGMKNFYYDVEVLKNVWNGEKYIRSWETLVENVPNRNFNDESWMASMMSSTSTATALVNPLGTIYNPMENDQYAVADGTAAEVKVFNSDGTYRHNIYATTPDWHTDGTVVTDVAVLPPKDGLLFDYEGGYLISLENGELWFSEYDVDRLLVKVDNCATQYPTGNFIEVVSIATNTDSSYNNEDHSEFDLYIVEKVSGSNYGLYHYETATDSGGFEKKITSASPDHHRQFNFPITSVEVIGNHNSKGNVFVLREDTDKVYVYSWDLSTLIGIIESSDIGWSQITDLCKSWNVNIGVLDQTTDTLYIIDGTTLEELNHVNLVHHGSSPTHVSVQNDYTDPLAWVAGGDGQYTKRMLFDFWDLRQNDDYYTWRSYDIPFADQLSAYRLSIHDFNTIDWFPLGNLLPAGDAPNLIGWRRPVVTETMYNWEYFSEYDGIDLAIVSPLLGENFVSYGIGGDFDVELDLHIRDTLHYIPPPALDFMFEVDVMEYKIDDGSWNEFSPSIKEEKSVELSESVGDETVIYGLSLPASAIYKFNALYPHTYVNDGDVWNLYLDNNFLITIDETLSGSIESGFPHDLQEIYADYIERGDHTLRFEWQSGLSKTLPEIGLFYDAYVKQAWGISEGFHNITIFVNDTNGWNDTAFTEFNVITYPDIDIIYPTEAMAINGTVELHFITSDNNLDSAIVNINDEFFDMATYIDNGSGNTIDYEKNISIDEFIPDAWNQIQIIVNDNETHQTFAYRTFFVDFTPPRINFPGMTNNSLLPIDNLYYINVTDETLTTAWYRINSGIEFDLENGINVITIPDAEFDEGWNVLEVYGEDYVGNWATAYLNLTKDSAAPVINLSQPIINFKYFEEGGVADIIPLKVLAYDTFINRSAISLDDVSQSQIDDYLRLHYNSYSYFIQEIVSEADCITDLRLNIRGLGILKVSLFEDFTLTGDPVSIGYLQVNNQINFQWETVDMANTRTVAGQKYYVKIESITLWNDLFLSVGNNPYDDGMVHMGGIPRPHWDLAFTWQYKEILNSSEETLTWYNINGEATSTPVLDGNITIANLTDIYNFDHGWNEINVFCEDQSGFLSTITVPIQYIDTSVTNNIEVALTSQKDSEWVFEDLIVTWETNVPDYVSRLVFENYTHEIYLLNSDGTYFYIDTVIDGFNISIDTKLVPDGFYYVFISSSDPTSTDTSTSAVFRILNDAPLAFITDPNNGEYFKEGDRVELTVICADLVNIFYAIEGSWNISIPLPDNYDFYYGYQFSFAMNSSFIDEGIHHIDIFVIDSNNQVTKDSVEVRFDTNTLITIEDMGTQADKGGILVTLDVPYDAEIVTMVIRNESSVFKTIIFTESAENITELYLIEEGLPIGAYEITVTVKDRAGNEASDTVSFLVAQSAYADILDSIFGIIAMILGFITGILALLMIAFIRKTHKTSKEELCSLYGGDFCSI